MGMMGHEDMNRMYHRRNIASRVLWLLYTKSKGGSYSMQWVLGLLSGREAHDAGGHRLESIFFGYSETPIHSFDPLDSLVALQASRAQPYRSIFQTGLGRARI